MGHLVCLLYVLQHADFYLEILRAARILHQMEKAYGEERGAFGLATEDGGKEMIDAPMLKQASIYQQTLVHHTSVN